MHLFLVMLALAGMLSAAQAAKSTRHWGGPDLQFSCETIRSWRAEINAMSAETKTALARQFNITRKMQRQAQACLR